MFSGLRHGVRSPAGNRLESVTNSGSEDAGTFSYTYDSSGNLSFDSRNGLDIRSNVLNLPGRIGTMGGTMTYTYLGDGTKVAARIGTSPRGVSGLAGKRYRGSFVYDVSAAGAESLESIAVSTGRLIALTGTGGTVSFESDGFITDHLGNVAAVVNFSAPASTPTENAILEQNCYTPFGTRLQSADLKTQAANRWRYAGKEEQNISGMDLGLLDFGARYYDPFTTRWNAVDPLAHKYFSISPYSYCGNDPICYLDPTGSYVSTHTDENGYVLAVYDDGDLGVYMHENGTTKEALDSKHTKENTSAGGTKMGESWQIDSFESFLKYEKPIIIYGSRELTDRVDQIMDSNPSIAKYALMAQGGGDWDIKTKVMNGSLLYGKYASPRDAGNFAAGMFSQSKGEFWSAIIDFGYGAYNVCGNKKLPTALLTAFVLFSPNTANYMSYLAEHGEAPISKNIQQMGKIYYKEKRK